MGLLARMFAARGSTLATNYRQLFASFLGRFNDKEVQIRLIMVEFARHFLVNHSPSISGYQDVFSMCEE